MLGTFVIGLREGLEAALVVGILAAFCKRNGASMRPMWFGIVTAVLLSIGVGITLEIVSTSLPQAQQEGMEAVISAVAIVFVTSMIVWMAKHARGLKKEIEAAAGDALREGTAWALAGMAFLAIVKEGFETSVFLLATFQASTSVFAAVLGAVLGILVAVGIGIGLYHGGIRFNIGKFFQVTGVFLVFVAAGLVISMLRSAHEAGWIVIGQGRTLDLGWLAPAGSVRAALITGVLGIPADPRVIEVVFWLLYLVPVLALVLWPAKRRPSGAAAARLQLTIGASLAVVAIALILLVPSVPAYRPGSPVPAVAAGSTGAATSAAIGSVVLDDGDPGALVVSPSDAPAVRTDLAGHAGVAGTHDGVEARETTWTTSVASSTTSGVSSALPARLTLDDLTTYAGGRLPVGVNPQTAHGPFDAAWTQKRSTDVWTIDGDSLLDARQTTSTILTLTGGGLAGPRTVTVGAASLGDGAIADWTVEPAYVTTTARGVAAAEQSARERSLWRTYLPAVLLATAVAFGAAGLVGRRKHARLAAQAATLTAQTIEAEQADTPTTITSRSTTHAR